MSKELVIHPGHYNKEGRRECWDEMIDIFGPEAVVIFDVLSAYKYNYRAGEKDGNPTEQDMAKIDNYMDHSKNVYLEKCCGWVDGQHLACKCWNTMNNILGGENEQHY